VSALFAPPKKRKLPGSVNDRKAPRRPIAVDLIEYFERQKQRCERELRYADTPGFQLFERTPQGEQDITELHIQQLREARDEYQRMIEYLKARDCVNSAVDK